MPRVWIEALKEWNKDKPMWCIPKKGSAEIDVVRKIAERMKAPTKTEPVKRKLRIATEPEPEMETPVKRKLRIPKPAEVPPKKESVPTTMEYFKYKEKKFASSYAIYKRVSAEPPVFESVFGATQKKVEKDGQPIKEITLKRNTKGEVLRDLEYVAKTDEYFAKAIRGEFAGQIVATLSPYKPADFEMNFISGKRDEAKYYEDYTEKELKDMEEESEKKEKKTARKDIGILTKRAIEEDAEIKKLNQRGEDAKEKRAVVFEKYQARINQAVKDKNRKLHDEIIAQMDKEYNFEVEYGKIQKLIKKREAEIRKKIKEDAK